MDAGSQSTQFFNSIAPFMSAEELEMVQTAYAFSKYGHRNQTREDGTRYFEHPRAVARMMFAEFGIYDWKVISMGLLHDLSEDTFLLTEFRIKLNFGKAISWGVRLLTKDKLSKENYYPRLKACGLWRPIVAKICDRLHNMSTLAARPRNKQLEQVAETREHFFELCDILDTLMPKKYQKGVHRMREMLMRYCLHYE